jgi:hypothetical protein
MHKIVPWISNTLASHEDDVIVYFSLESNVVIDAQYSKGLRDDDTRRYAITLACG